MLIKMDCANSGGGLQISYCTPTTLSNAKITTGFKPKYILCAYRYTSNQVMGCYYNADVSENEYKRVYQATVDTQTKPWNNAGFASIDNDGFTMNTSSLPNFSYIAVG